MVKKIIIYIDMLLIIATVALMLYFNYRKTYGVIAWGDVGRVVACMIALGLEIFILIIVVIIYFFFDKKNM